MAIDDNIRDEKLPYDTNRKAAKYQHYHLVKLINMNILQVKKYYQKIKEERQHNLILHILLSLKHLKNK